MRTPVAAAAALARIEALLRGGVASSAIAVVASHGALAREFEHVLDVSSRIGTYDIKCTSDAGFAAACVAEFRASSHRPDANHPSLFPPREPGASLRMLLRDQLHDLPLRMFRPPNAPHRYLDDLLAHFSMLASAGVSPEAYSTWAASPAVVAERGHLRPGAAEAHTELAAFYAAWWQSLHDTGCFSLLGGFAQCALLLRSGDRDAFVDAAWDRWRHVLVLNSTGLSAPGWGLLASLFGSRRRRPELPSSAVVPAPKAPCRTLQLFVSPALEDRYGLPFERLSGSLEALARSCDAGAPGSENTGPTGEMESFRWEVARVDERTAAAAVGVRVGGGGGSQGITYIPADAVSSRLSHPFGGAYVQSGGVCVSAAGASAAARPSQAASRSAQSAPNSAVVPPPANPSPATPATSLPVTCIGVPPSLDRLDALCMALWHAGAVSGAQGEGVEGSGAAEPPSHPPPTIVMVACSGAVQGRAVMRALTRFFELQRAQGVRFQRSVRLQSDFQPSVLASQEVRLLLSLLGALAHPDNPAHTYHLATSPVYGVPRTALASALGRRVAASHAEPQNGAVPATVSASLGRGGPAVSGDEPDHCGEGPSLRSRLHAAVAAGGAAARDARLHGKTQPTSPHPPHHLGVNGDSNHLDGVTRLLSDLQSLARLYDKTGSVTAVLARFLRLSGVGSALGEPVGAAQEEAGAALGAFLELAAALERSATAALARPSLLQRQQQRGGAAALLVPMDDSVPLFTVASAGSDYSSAAGEELPWGIHDSRSGETGVMAEGGAAVAAYSDYGGSSPPRGGPKPHAWGLATAYESLLEASQSLAVAGASSSSVVEVPCSSAGSGGGGAWLYQQEQPSPWEAALTASHASVLSTLSALQSGGGSSGEGGGGDGDGEAPLQALVDQVSTAYHQQAAAAATGSQRSPAAAGDPGPHPSFQPSLAPLQVIVTRLASVGDAGCDLLVLPWMSDASIPGAFRPRPLPLPEALMQPLGPSDPPPTDGEEGSHQRSAGFEWPPLRFSTADRGEHVARSRARLLAAMQPVRLGVLCLAPARCADRPLSALGKRSRFLDEWLGPPPPAHSSGSWEEALRNPPLAVTATGGAESFAKGALLAAPVPIAYGYRVAGSSSEIADIAGSTPPAPLSLSFSGMGTYAQCPQRYFFSHVTSTPDAVTAPRRYGSALHEAAAALGLAVVWAVRHCVDTFEGGRSGVAARLESLRASAATAAAATAPSPTAAAALAYPGAEAAALELALAAATLAELCAPGEEGARLRAWLVVCLPPEGDLEAEMIRAFHADWSSAPDAAPAVPGNPAPWGSAGAASPAEGAAGGASSTAGKPAIPAAAPQSQTPFYSTVSQAEKVSDPQTRELFAEAAAAVSRMAAREVRSLRAALLPCGGGPLLAAPLLATLRLPALIEHRFLMPLPPPQGPRDDGRGQVLLKGVIDRVDVTVVAAGASGGGQGGSALLQPAAKGRRPAKGGPATPAPSTAAPTVAAPLTLLSLPASPLLGAAAAAVVLRIREFKSSLQWNVNNAADLPAALRRRVLDADGGGMQLACYALPMFYVQERAAAMLQGSPYYAGAGVQVLGATGVDAAVVAASVSSSATKVVVDAGAATAAAAPLAAFAAVSVRGAIESMESGDSSETDITAGHCAALTATAATTAEAIRARRFDPAPTLSRCGMCSYASVCQDAVGTTMAVTRIGLAERRDRERVEAGGSVGVN